MTAHKWADEIKAWADGKAIEQRYASPQQNANQVWHAFDRQWDKQLGWEYRIKPEPMHKPDFFVHTPLSFYDAEWGRTFTATNVRFLFDGETHQLKSVRMIGKPDPTRMETALFNISLYLGGQGNIMPIITEALRTD